MMIKNKIQMKLKYKPCVPIFMALIKKAYKTGACHSILWVVHIVFHLACGKLSTVMKRLPWHCFYPSKGPYYRLFGAKTGFCRFFVHCKKSHVNQVLYTLDLCLYTILSPLIVCKREASVFLCGLLKKGGGWGKSVEN
jgi:hypothetical protein